jgi:high-affinity K+ transport system ATPase subunit B
VTDRPCPPGLKSRLHTQCPGSTPGYQASYGHDGSAATAFTVFLSSLERSVTGVNPTLDPWFKRRSPHRATGTNDAPALAQADVGVAMNTGTQAAKEAGNMIDLDSNPTKLIEVVEIGKQLLMTRGALTTFSIANDVAKYFAIIPAMFLTTFPALNALNIMGLRTPHSAILSAVIFNAVIIVVLVPLALRGISYRPQSAAALLRRNLLVYGVGGLVAPFVGIKAIDVVIATLGLG